MGFAGGLEWIRGAKVVNSEETFDEKWRRNVDESEEEASAKVGFDLLT